MEKERDFKHDIFISYKSQNRTTAQALAALLEEQGWSVWWDREILDGTFFDEEIEEALNSARCVIVLWSKLSVVAPYVKAEARAALAREVLVPIKIEEASPALVFREVQTADLIGWQAGQDTPGVQKMLRSVSAIIEASRKPRAKRRSKASTKPRTTRPKTILQEEVLQLIKYAKNRFQEIKGEEVENEISDIIKDLEFKSTFHISGIGRSGVFLTPDGKYYFDAHLDKLDERTATGMYEKAASEIRAILNSDWVIKVISGETIEKYLSATNSRDGLEMILQTLNISEDDNGYFFQLTLYEL